MDHQTAVVTLMLQFSIVHVEEVYICIGVPVTVPIGELPHLADRELITCSTFAVISALIVSTASIFWNILLFIIRRGILVLLDRVLLDKS